MIARIAVLVALAVYPFYACGRVDQMLRSGLTGESGAATQDTSKNSEGASVQDTISTEKTTSVGFVVTLQGFPESGARAAKLAPSLSNMKLWVLEVGTQNQVEFMDLPLVNGQATASVEVSIGVLLEAVVYFIDSAGGGMAYAAEKQFTALAGQDNISITAFYTGVQSPNFPSSVKAGNDLDIAWQAPAQVNALGYEFDWGLAEGGEPFPGDPPDGLTWTRISVGAEGTVHLRMEKAGQLYFRIRTKLRHGLGHFVPFKGTLIEPKTTIVTIHVNT